MPALARPNLTVEIGALHQVRAAAEVILSGGTYASSQLLLLSGIGPADELRTLGVTPMLDLPAASL
jgi:choline dehydrogenase